MNNMNVSVVITAFNSESFVREAVESVLRQTLPVDEVIVVDDGSSDSTGEIVMQFADQGVRYLYQDNQGPGAARNRGVRETNGELIAFLDADDIWLEHKIQLQKEYLLEHPDIALVSGFAWWWNVAKGTRKLSGEHPRNRKTLKREILVHNIVGNPSMVLLRRDALLEVGLFNPDIQWGQDWDLWIRLIDRYNLAFIPEPVIVYRWHLKNISHIRRFERLESFWNVSRNGIRKYGPAWLRPLLLVRSWSRINHRRAIYAIDQKNTRWRQVFYAGGAFIAFPWEKGFEKFRTLVRSVVGDDFYQDVKKVVRSWQLT